ncbi:MAG: hypothetical protein LBF94_03675 [Puniceicoccales bacterium]|nr:hypothetical protein [Puniceicoccales bacterium]
MNSDGIENPHLRPTNPNPGPLDGGRFAQSRRLSLSNLPPNHGRLEFHRRQVGPAPAIPQQIPQQEDVIRLSQGMEYLRQPEELSPLNLPANIPGELRPFERFIGTGLRKSESPATYRQILPENIWEAAVGNFDQLSEDEQRMFLEILNNFDNHNPKAESDLLAISTMFSMLAYGENFLKAFLREGTGNCIASLQISNLYSEVQQNFEQNYLNTCVAVSMFTALSTAFVGNIKLLSDAISMEIEQVRIKLREHADAEKLSNPAFSSHSWRAAPTIQEEVERRIEQCQTAIDTVNRKATNPGINKAEIENCQKELLRAYERMCAIREVFSQGGIQAPNLLSLRPVQNFVGACILTLAGNIVAKAGSLGLYIGSLSLPERFAGISKIASPLFEESRESTSIDTWERTFKNGIMLEKRPGHMVARKAAFDRNGNKVFVIYDPIREVPEVVPVSV